jgi:SAM-dependent methyltransferase
LHDPAIARDYDAGLAESSLPAVDVIFARKWFDRPGRLIDLGCGTGRLLLPFAKRGYWTLGVDLSEEMLRVVGEKATAAEIAIHRLRANVVELEGLRDQSFNYAACLFSTLGMIAGAAERRQVLAHAHRLMKPGGRFILHVHNRWFNVCHREGRRWLILNGLRALVGIEGAGDKHMPVHQGVAGLTLHLFTRGETVGLLRDAGFRILEIQPVSIQGDGRVRAPWWLGGLCAYGYLIAAERARV